MRLKILMMISICILLYGCKDRELKAHEVRKQLDSMMVKPKENEKMEYMLASIEAGYYLPRDDASIGTFRALLRELDEKFPEGEKQIGDISVSTKFMLRDRGIQESLLNIMEGMNQMPSGKLANLKYAECTSFYLGLRKKYSHKSAIKALKIMIQNRGTY